MELVLASRSPRRVSLLSSRGISFVVDPADVDETPFPGEQPAELARRLASLKHSAVAVRHPGATVIAADTVVDLDGLSLGQPSDDAAATRTIADLSGRTHLVHTAVMVGPAGSAKAHLETSRVTFRELTPGRISWYVATGEPRGKAGAYAVQGLGMCLVARVEGSLTNVIGLPVGPTLDLLARRPG
ncbi:MAG: Maf family protein [Actinomycetota bacterium]